MHEDDLLEVLKAQWRQQPVDMDRARALISRRERWVRTWLWFNRIGVVVALAAAAWFVVRAWDTGEALLILGAAGLLAALPFMIAEQWWLRQHRAPDHLETPEAVLAQARRQAQTSLQLLSGCRLGAAILIACALAVWALHGAAAVSLRATSFLSLLWASTAALLLLWQGRRRRLARAELEECDRIAAEMASAN